MVKVGPGVVQETRVGGEPGSGPLEIRALGRAEEYRAVEELQALVWRFPDREIVPMSEMILQQRHGGLVLGAFERDRMIAFCYGCPAFLQGKVFHHSRMLGVLPGYQNSGIGHRMKLAQREWALAQGLERITWTFDPLQSRNAYFNLEKLGVIVSEYLLDLYPGSASSFNQGLKSDRFVAEWPIASSRVRDRVRGERPSHDPVRYEPVLAAEHSADGLVLPVPIRPRPASDRVSIEIPGDLGRLKERGLQFVQDWREATRQAFVSLFADGYVLHGLGRLTESGAPRILYLLEKGYSGS